jgi:hypothetical protein
MNLIEAIKSGKPFRIKGSSYDWNVPEVKMIGMSKEAALAEYEINLEPREWDVYVSADGNNVMNADAVAFFRTNYEIKNVRKIRVREIIE